MEDDGFGSFEGAPAAFPAFESAPAAAPAAAQPQAAPAAQRPQTAPAAESKVRVVGITDAAAQKAAPPAAAACASGSSSWGGWGGGWLSSAASAMPQSTAALDSMSSMMSVTSCADTYVPEPRTARTGYAHQPPACHRPYVPPEAQGSLALLYPNP